MDAAQIAAFGQLPKNQARLVLGRVTGMLRAAVCRSQVRFPFLSEAEFFDPPTGATIRANAWPGGDYHHQNL
jgi:hypothetical protein